VANPIVPLVLTRLVVTGPRWSPTIVASGVAGCSRGSPSWKRSIGGTRRSTGGPLEVVVTHPRIQLGLGVLEDGEHLAVEELAAQLLVPPLHLAGRRR
jgi:hypothetical protein